mgnify:CR=1 FL=1
MNNSYWLRTMRLCQKVKGDWTGPSIGISESFETDFVERLLI